MKLIILTGIFLTTLVVPSAQAQTLKVCLDSPAYEADLHKATDTSSVEVFHKKVYESLIKFNKKEKGYFTLLAKKVTMVGSKSITIDLKQNIKFHSNKHFKPTRTMNADDVVFSFKRQMSRYIKSKEEKRSFSNFRSRGLDKKIIDIVKISPYKVSIRTNKRMHNIYELLSEHFLSIFSYEYFQKLKKKNKEKFFTSMPIGTGPFLFLGKKKSTLYKLKTFKGYHGKVPSFEKLNFYIITNNQKRTQYTLKGKCHITHNPSWSLIRDITNHKDLRVENYEENNTLFLALNHKSKIIRDKDVRKAIALALNYKKYMKTQFFGYSKRANHLLTPNFKEYSNDYLAVEQDLAKAKELLKNKYSRPVTLNLWTITVPRPYIPDGVELAKLVKKDLEAIGFKVVVHKPDFKTFLKKTGQGAHDIAIVGFANLTDQQEILLSLSCDAIKGGTNRSMWCNKKYDQLMNLYFSTKIKGTKEAYLKQASLIFNTEKPRIPIAYMGKKKVISKKILNFNSSNDSSGDYSKIIFMDAFLGKQKK